MKRKFTFLFCLFMVAALLSCKKKESAQSEKAVAGASKDFTYSDFVKDGRPDYAKLKSAGLPGLDALLDSYKTFDTASLKTINDKKAFWINLYNLFAMKIVTEGFPEKEDIFKIDGFFDLKTVNVGGRNYTLDNISSTELKFGKDTKDPRINFAISSGTKSSPKLAKALFTGTDLEKELDECTRNFVRDPKNFLLEGETVYLSEIFRWFEADFGGQGGVLKFVAGYLSEKDSKALLGVADKVSLTYNQYDWSFDGIAR